MNKDVIYIDVEDDVTAIIGKIKSSNEKIIALVPPKSAGILQSAVNLRLLDRMATTNHKHLVLITNNQALMSLSAAAGIPVAKNLQSKPELPEISALSVDDDDDIIDGSSLPIGELARTADIPVGKPEETVEDALGELDIDEKSVDIKPKVAQASKPNTSLKSNIKVPNFNTFRKKLFLGIGALVLLIAFLVWANVYAPSASVVVTAKTVSSPISTVATLGGANPTDLGKGTIQSISQQLKKDLSVKFDATGTKDVGDKATGTVRFSKQTLTSYTIPAGTRLSSGNLVFITTESATVPVSVADPNCFPAYCPGTVDASVEAENGGTSYNGITGSLSGAPNGTSATLVSATSGGTSKTATVVTDLDVQKATDALKALATTDYKKQLTSLFTNGEIIIDQSFNVDYGTPVSTPAVGAEATAQATLTTNATFTIIGLAKSDVELYLKASLDKQLTGISNQKIYADGIDKVVITSYNKSADTTTINITANGEIGPNIDPDTIKEQIKGKKSGEAISVLTNISGVSDVTVKFSYPWVTVIPKDNSKVDIQFKLTND
jgi:hypothetical protein